MALYMFDNTGEVYGSLSADPVLYMVSAIAAPSATSYIQTLNSLAEAATPVVEARDSVALRRQLACCGGALVAMNSFYVSDISPDAQFAVSQQVATTNIQLTALDIENMSVRGAANHPELERHAELLDWHYSNRGGGSMAGRLSKTGLFVTAALLDSAIVGQEDTPVFTVDWDAAAKLIKYL